MNFENDFLYKKVKKKGFLPQHACEVGVWDPSTSNLSMWIGKCKITFIEPDEASIALIEKIFSSLPSITLHKVAICDFNGEVVLCKRESSTFIRDLELSPAIANDECDKNSSDTFMAKAIKFNEIDLGDIDLLSVDTEGSEWFVIKNMISRPEVISLETHGGLYLNPYLTEILTWMKTNNYVIWYKGKSDTVFVKKDGKIKVSIFDMISLFFAEARNGFTRIRKAIKKKIKSICIQKNIKRS